LQVKIEEQKRDPKIGKKYIIFIYKGIKEGVQIPLSPPLKATQWVLFTLQYYLEV